MLVLNSRTPTIVKDSCHSVSSGMSTMGWHHQQNVPSPQQHLHHHHQAAATPQQRCNMQYNSMGGWPAAKSAATHHNPQSTSMMMMHQQLSGQSSVSMQPQPHRSMMNNYAQSGSYVNNVAPNHSSPQLLPSSSSTPVQYHAATANNHEGMMHLNASRPPPMTGQMHMHSKMGYPNGGNTVANHAPPPMTKAEPTKSNAG